MPLFAAEDLARWTGGTWTSGPRGRIEGFGIDSRHLRPGELFVALKTDRRDGHEFLAAAEAAGAAGALVAGSRRAGGLPQLVVPDPLAAFHAIAREHRRRFPGRVVAVSGSAGKTSTKELLAILLDEAGRVLATEGNLNNHLGVPLTLTRLDGDRHSHAVIEAGISAPGEMAALADMIGPDAAVITLVGPAHLQELGGLEGVAREKARLVRGVRSGGVAVFPRSCAAYAAFRDLPVPALAADFSLQPGADRVEIVMGGGERFVLPAPSEGMARNAALALRLALHWGVAAETLRARLARWRPAPGRGEIRRDPARIVYLDHYNANPASMADSLAAFQRLAPERDPRLYVLGGMEELGPDEERFHRELGASFRLRDGDRILFVGPQGGAVRAGALAAGARPGQIILADTAAAGAPLVADFVGAIFVKGSRKHRLEDALSPAEVSVPC